MENLIQPGLTFSDYFLKGAVTDPLYLVIASVLAGFAGMGSHWWKRFFKDQTDASFIEYFFKINIKATLTAVATMVGAVLTAILPLEIATVTLYSVLITGYTIGYASDSAFNSDTPVN